MVGGFCNIFLGFHPSNSINQAFLWSGLTLDRRANQPAGQLNSQQASTTASHVAGSRTIQWGKVVGTVCFPNHPPAMGSLVSSAFRAPSTGTPQLSPILRPIQLRPLIPLTAFGRTSEPRLWFPRLGAFSRSGRPSLGNARTVTVWRELPSQGGKGVRGASCLFFLCRGQLLK